jgi:hypothetical protein
MKLIYSFLFLLIVSLSASAQCVPDTSITHNDPGIYPDSATGLPHAVVGIAYNTDIQVKVLSDTSYLGLPAIVDSINVTGVTGMPSGFAYSCFPANCSFPGESDACILLYGSAPTAGMVGNYPIVVHMTIYGKVFGVPQTLQQDNSSYSITIDNNVGIGNVNSTVFSVSQNLPNPASSSTRIPVTVPHNGTAHLTISNLIGRIIYSHDVQVTKGANYIPFNTSELNPGIYLYSVSFGNAVQTRRMIVTEN